MPINDSSTPRAKGGSAPAGPFTLALHQNTSAGAGFRGSLEGWARAGITQVELTNALLDDFLASDTLAGARRVMDDLGLTCVSGACGVVGLLEDTPDRPQAVDAFRRRCDQWAALQIPVIYVTTHTVRVPDANAYAAAPACVHELGDIAKAAGLTVLVEPLRSSPFISTITTMLQVLRAAAHPSARLLFDCYHFWSGLGKLDDLDAVRQGEIGHVHIQDVPDMPRERLDSFTRIIPGDGVAPLTTILQKVHATGYTGPASVELFLPQFTEADPFMLATEITAKTNAVLRRATPDGRT